MATVYALASLCVSTAAAFLCLAVLEYTKARTYRTEASAALQLALTHLNSAEEYLARVHAETPESDPDGASDVRYQ